MSDPRMINPFLPIFSKNWVLFLIWGIILLILGILALVYTTLTTLLSVIILGFVIFTGGIIIMLDSFTFWRQKFGGFLIHFLMGLIYFLVGLYLIAAPAMASLSLTLLLGIFYVFIGLYRLFYSASLKAPFWGWTVLNGLIALILGVLILAQWPASSLFIIGLFVGIDLIFLGWAYIMSALSGRRYHAKIMLG